MISGILHQMENLTKRIIQEAGADFYSRISRPCKFITREEYKATETPSILSGL